MKTLTRNEKNSATRAMSRVLGWALMAVMLLFGSVQNAGSQGFLKGLMDVDVVKHSGGLEEQQRYLPFKGKTGRIHFYYFAADKAKAEKYIEKNKLVRAYTVDREYARQTASTARAELTKALKAVLNADQVKQFNALKNNPFEANLYVYTKEHETFPMFIVFDGADKCITKDQIRAVLQRLTKVKLPVLPTAGLKNPKSFYVFEPAIHTLN